MLEERIKRVTDSKRTPWLAHYEENNSARVRLFCFPYSGGGAAIFKSWPHSLPTEIEVCPVQLPGRETRFKEAPFNRMELLTEAIGHGLSSYFDKPAAFFGHSLGALVSFELIRLIRERHGLTPVHLFVSGCRAPHIEDSRSPLHILPDNELIEELKRLRGTPQVLLDDSEFVRLLLPIFRADLEISETYVHSIGRPLTCPITAFGGLQDSEISSGEMDDWRVHTASDFMLHMLPGDHFFIHTARQRILSVLSNKLGRYSETNH